MDTQREMDKIYRQYRQGSDDQPEGIVNPDDQNEEPIDDDRSYLHPSRRITIDL